MRDLKDCRLYLWRVESRLMVTQCLAIYRLLNVIIIIIIIMITAVQVVDIYKKARSLVKRW